LDDGAGDSADRGADSGTDGTGGGPDESPGGAAGDGADSRQVGAFGAWAALHAFASGGLGG
jgi:hypothetical protein